MSEKLAEDDLFKIFSIHSKTKITHHESQQNNWCH